MIMYLSGPMSGIKDHNIPLFNREAGRLREAGYHVVNPADLDKQMPQTSWDGCLRRDIRVLMDCDVIATLPGFRKSRGATLETYIGRELGMSIHPVSYWIAIKGKNHA